MCGCAVRWHSSMLTLQFSVSSIFSSFLVCFSPAAEPKGCESFSRLFSASWFHHIFLFPAEKPEGSEASRPVQLWADFPGRLQRDHLWASTPAHLPRWVRPGWQRRCVCVFFFFFKENHSVHWRYLWSQTHYSALQRRSAHPPFNYGFMVRCCCEMW